ncbi:MFS transporter [Flexivirga sp. ID2601S]|uniref:MFS transporter n=1 Tax=Flexivirga aerilata TaxID=1656889 RepID=A0A849AJZ0_9MICO|nr:MFS transporter [Flexivirga aerilata]NNG38710.1 MFS transporter [Flexivirga aerilata]
MSDVVTVMKASDVQAHPRRWAGLVVLAGSLLVVAMDMTILNVALPSIGESLRPSATQTLWIVDVYSLVLAGLLVTVSALGDRWGRRLMLIGGFTIFGLASIGALVVDSPAALIALRALLGVGGAMIMPSTLSMVRVLFTDPRERATALAIWGSMAAVGAAVGPIIGGLLLEHFSWHAAFLVNVPVMVAAIVGAFLLLPSSGSARPAPLDLVATAQSMVGMVALIYGIKQVAKHGLDPAGVVALTLAAVALTMFVRRCLRVERPILQVRLFRHRGFTAGTLTALGSTMALVAVVLLGAQWLQLVDGRSPLEAGIALLPLAIGGLVGALSGPAIAARAGMRLPLAGGLVLAAIGYLVLYAAPDPLPYSALAVATALIGVGEMSLAVGSAAIMASAPTHEAGSAAAVEESSYEVGATLGVAVLGSVAAAVYRGELSTGHLAELGVPADAAGAVRESLASATALAPQLGSGHELLTEAQTAFTHSLTTTSLWAAVVMAATAALVWWLTPRDLQVTDGHH